MDGNSYLMNFSPVNPLTVRREYHGHKGSVSCSTWSNQFHMFATAGMDKTVMLWTPYNSSPLAALTGHTATITHLQVRREREQKKKCCTCIEE